ncbi:GPR endopeptidase [Dorea sp. OM02-2LB]|nr:GPR endopeptidase [Dorea sp. OM02-2LB]RGV93340.1 GPR endopeptidase [Ruminococcus sp. AF14-10]
MLDRYEVRTDLALEEKEKFESDDVEVKGVILEEDYDAEREIQMTRVIIQTEKGARTMGKPVGTYITLEAPNLVVPDESYHREVSVRLAGHVKELMEKLGLREKEDCSVLIVGLGNRDVTPDALGPNVADQVCVNRHVVKEYGKYAMGMDVMNLVSAITPGVMGKTGMETVEIVRGIVEQTHPDLVIAVDALAARNSKRLNRTIQIADTGIHPGSGVGNHRNGLTRESLGVPVIAIGVPTVVDAATIVNDTMENLIRALETSDSLKGVGEVLRSYNGTEKYELVKELISPHLNGMYMTPKDVDEMVVQIGFTISEGLNLLFAGDRNEKNEGLSS